MADEKGKSNKAWWQPAVVLFTQVSAWIVFPIIIALLLGQWLDRRYGRESFFLLLCIGAAFVITNVGLIVQTVKMARKIKEEDAKINKK